MRRYSFVSPWRIQNVAGALVAPSRRCATRAALCAAGGHKARGYILTLSVLSVCLSSCVLAPRAARDERARVAAAGEPYARPFAERELPDLPPEPTWRDLLQRAFLVNGDLEAAYLDWSAAVTRIDRAAGYPNTNLSLGYEYMFSGENLKAWNRTTLSIGFDPMQNLSFPTKVFAAGRVALAEAEAAGHRFASAKFALQRRVLSAYLDYALRAEQVRLRSADTELAAMTVIAATSQVNAGVAQGTLLEADAAHRRALNALRALRADLVALQAMLNALVARPPDAPLPPPSSLPAARALAADDAEILALAAVQNPELQALAGEVRGRTHALALARQRFLPDINPFAGITGSIEQFAGAAITLATTIPQIRAGIAESRAMLQRGEAMLRQGQLDRAAELVAALSLLRDSERQVLFLETEVVPIVEQKAEVATNAYAAGSVELTEAIDAQRAALELQDSIAEARILREKKLAEIEALLGVDVETIGTGSSPSLAMAGAQ